MKWRRATELELATPCLACGLMILPGERCTIPKEEGADGRGCLHLSCDEAARTLALADPEAPVCKHWHSRGFCLYAERCVFRHPPECLEVLRHQQASLAARQAALGTANSGRIGAQRPGQRRGAPKNRFRASALRRFLLDTFGQDKLREGTGVLDVAGGKGKLAFELLNLSGIRATVLEPRPLDLKKRIKWLLKGVYHWNTAFASYNEQRWVGSRSCVDQGSLLQQPHHLEQRQPGEEQRQAATKGAAAAGGGALLPDHLRLVVTPELAACLTVSRSGRSRGSSVCTRCGGSIGSSISSLSSSGSSSSLWQLADCQLCQQQADSIRSAAMPAEWPAVFEQARRQAQHGRWRKPGSPHQPELAPAAMAGGFLNKAEWGASSSQPAAAALVTADPLAARGCARRPAVAWSIPADGESEDDDHYWCGKGSGTERSGGSKGEAAFALTPVSSQQDVQGGEQQPIEVCDAAAAWRCFVECSIVVGCHPDQATEFIVDLAIAHGKPFALVPCCVYSAEFPRRRLKGEHVTRYEQFLEYLIAKDAVRIRVATLPFEGRNRVLYRTTA